MLHSDGVDFFWHTSTSSVAGQLNINEREEKCLFAGRLGLAMNGLRHEACGIADGAMGAKSVTEKTTRGRGLGGAAKIQRSPQQSV